MPPPNKKRPDFPHVHMIKDPVARRTITKLYERLNTVEDRQGTTKQPTGTPTIQSSVATIQANLNEMALNQAFTNRDVTILKATANKVTVTQAQQGQTPTQPPQPVQPPQTDNGLGEKGCNEHGPTGHVDPTLPRNAETAGMIVCGVGSEFPALLAVVADQPTRDANRNQLLDRMVWHLNLQGFPTSRYPTANGRPWILLMQIMGSQYAYRVTSYDTFQAPMSTAMVFGGITPNTGVVPDGGISD